MAAATMHVTPAGAGDKSGSSKANAMGLAEWLTDMINSAEAGDIYLVYGDGGTYTATANRTIARSGSASGQITIRGVDASGDPATGSDRPLINTGAYWWYWNCGYWNLENVRGTGTYDNGSFLLAVSDHYTIWNCSFDNTSGAVNRIGLRAYGDGRYLNVESTSSNGPAFDCNGKTSQISHCYFHDATYGIKNLLYRYCFFTVIDSCTTGVSLDAGGNQVGIEHCVFYNCTTGLSGGTIDEYLIINCIFESCTTGASWVTEQKNNWFDYNNWHGNTADVSNVTKGPNATAHDPDFEDAGAGDFRLKTGSSCLTAGQPITLGVASDSFTTSAALAGSGVLSGSTSVTFAASGVLSVLPSPITGSTNLAFAASGQVAAKGTLTGTAALSFVASAAPSGSGLLSGLVQLAFTAAAEVTATDALTGAVPLTFGLAGSLAGNGALVGSIPLTFAISANLEAGGAILPIGLLQSGHYHLGV